MDYGKLLGRIREKGLTQVDVANKVGMSAATLNKKLRGHTEFTQSEILALCNVLEIDDADLTTYFFAEKLKKS